MNNNKQGKRPRSQFSNDLCVEDGSQPKKRERLLSRTEVPLSEMDNGLESIENKMQRLNMRTNQQLFNNFIKKKSKENTSKFTKVVEMRSKEMQDLKGLKTASNGPRGPRFRSFYDDHQANESPKAFLKSLVSSISFDQCEYDKHGKNALKDLEEQKSSKKEQKKALLAVGYDKGLNVELSKVKPFTRAQMKLIYEAFLSPTCPVKSDDEKSVKKRLTPMLISQSSISDEIINEFEMVKKMKSHQQ